MHQLTASGDVTQGDMELQQEAAEKLAVITKLL